MILTELRKEKMVESHRRALNEPAVWRLTLKARKQLGVKKRPAYLQGREVPHLISIADALIWLLNTRKLHPDIKVEPVVKYALRGKMKSFDPDAFFIWNGQPFFFEYQSPKSDLSGKEWARKWEKRNEYMEVEAWRKVLPIEPKFLVLTRQAPSKVKTGAEFPVHVINEIQKIAWVVG